MLTEERFIGIDYSQVMAGKKHLLYIEMELLTSMQKYDLYKKFRKEESALRNLLKKEISEAKKEMEILSEYFPPIKSKSYDIETTKSTTTKRNALEEEIRKIRSKIATLSNSQ